MSYPQKGIMMTLLIICIFTAILGVCIAAEPQSAEDYYKLGQDLLAKKDSKAALDAFNKAIELNPNYAEAYYGLATAQNNLGLYTAAIISLNKVIELVPGTDLTAKALATKAWDLQKLGDNAAAAAALQQAQQLNPKYTAPI